VLTKKTQIEKKEAGRAAPAMLAAVRAHPAFGADAAPGLPQSFACRPARNIHWQARFAPPHSRGAAISMPPASGNHQHGITN